jgi:hypothetical protein
MSVNKKSPNKKSSMKATMSPSKKKVYSQSSKVCSLLKTEEENEKFERHAQSRRQSSRAKRVSYEEAQNSDSSNSDNEEED